MIFRRSALFVSMAAFAAVMAFSQSLPAAQDSASSEGSGPFPLLLLALADDGGDSWTPAWPMDFPPDAFSVKKKDARSIELVVEPAVPATEADAIPFSATARWDGKGRLLEYPFAEAGSFSPVTLRRSQQGRTIGLGIAAAMEGEATTVTFMFSPDGLVQSAALEAGSGRSFAAFRFRGTQAKLGRMLTYWGATETRAGEDGVVTAVVDYSFGGGKIISLENHAETGEAVALIDLDYDSAGRIVSVKMGRFDAEALYDGSGRVVYWRFGGSERRFQWDERGLLVRELASENGDRTELRYEYALDARGNWTERRTTRWVERFGSLVGEGGNSARRKIRYR